MLTTASYVDFAEIGFDCQLVARNELWLSFL